MDMRHWFISTQKGAANTMVLKSLHDEQIVTDKDGNDIICFSREAEAASVKNKRSRQTPRSGRRRN